MSCSYDTIIATVNVGTDGHPVIEVRAECNGALRDECGFSELFLDSEGDPHDPYDFWVLSSDMNKYDKMHRQHQKD
jgi:hypothetical protein